MIYSSTMLPEEHVPFAAEIVVKNYEESMRFYTTLGFEVLRIDVEHRFASLKFQTALFMIQEGEVRDEKDNGVLLRFYLQDGLRELYDVVISCGLTIEQPYDSTPYGLERFKLRDPDGYVIKFAQGIRPD